MGPPYPWVEVSVASPHYLRTALGWPWHLTLFQPYEAGSLWLMLRQSPESRGAAGGALGVHSL